MRRVVVGTAGHIDHGKTRLVEALTGIDCDRWQEEKSRGITIDLGFAHLEQGDLQLGFVDVPGHQRFLHNALAGLGGIRIMLLVVAADEGVKPQTREHLDICSLLGIPGGLVALTRCDLVEPDLRELAALEVEELLAPTRFAGAPVVAVSSVTGEGLPELLERLIELAERLHQPPDLTLPARLPIDRAFHLKGLGVVVTGTLASGAIRPGDTLEVVPGGATARVRSIQVHGAGRGEAQAGERTALQLTGVSLEALHRGLQLATPGAVAGATSLLARFTLLPDAPAELSGWTPVRVHCHASEILGRLRPLGAEPLRPGASGTVEIRLARAMAAVRGDRIIVRRPSPAATLGGGRLLDPGWHRRRGKPLAAALAALEGNQESTLLLWVAEAGEAGVAAADLARRLGTGVEAVEKRLEALAADQRLLAIGSGRGRRWLATATLARVNRRATRALKEYFGRQRLARGMPKAEAVARILPRRAAELADTYLSWLEAQKVLSVAGDLVDLPGRRAELTGEESQLSLAVLERFERAGLTPPSPGEVRQELAAKPQILDGMLRYLVSRGKLRQLPGGLYIAASAVDELVAQLRATGWERFSVGTFKDRFGLSRKWAIPLLEHLDSTGVTRRLGDERQIVSRPPAR